MNFTEYFKQNLPQWASKNRWINTFYSLLIFPSDVTLQSLNFVPKLRDLKGKSVAEQDMLILGEDFNMPSTYKEPAETYRLRLLETWNSWHECGSPHKMKELFDLTIYKLDQTPIINSWTNNYGILEFGHDLDNEVACWKETNDKWPVYWSAFTWGANITRHAVFSIFLIDPDLTYNQNQNTHLKSIVNLVNKFKPGHTKLYKIYSTDGSGNILGSFEVPDNF